MKVIDGCNGAANMAYNLSEMSFIYPITPSSPMASQIDLLSNLGKKNIFDDTVKSIEMQSEAGAAGAMHGALVSGALATTFTSSQGLLLMLPNMYKIAGEMLPCVIHVAARSIATHALSIFGDHQDIYAARPTGFSILASTNVQDAHNLALITHLSAIESSMPFLHFFDGFRTSHEINVINEISKDNVKKLVNYEKIKKFRDRALNSGKSITKGTAQNEDIYFQLAESKNTIYNNLPNIVETQMNKLNNLIGTNYAPFNYHGSKNAKYIIVAMGSVCDTVKEVVNNLNKESSDYGLVEVHLYRPFSKSHFEKAIPESAEKIAVLDRTKENGSTGEPLYLDVLATLGNKKYDIYGGRYGLSSKNTTPSDINDVFMMLKNNPKNNFTISIIDDITHTNLPKYEYDSKSELTEFKIYGFGSDGMVSASKDILKILGKNKYVQGYFEYDSKKSGGVTISHLRTSKALIKAPYYVENPELIVVTKDEYFHMFEMITNIKVEGTLLINTNKSEEELNKFLPTSVKEILMNRNITVYTVDAETIAQENNIRGKISLILEANILYILNYENYDEILCENINTRFAEKGQEIVDANINCVKNSELSLRKVKINSNNSVDLTINESIFAKINARQGNCLKVSELLDFQDGTFPGGTTKDEKRKISKIIPKWDPKDCIECGICSFVCPHAVVRPFILDKDSKYKSESKPSFEKEKNFIISISEADCTGCGLCIKECPKNCFTTGEFDQNKQDIADDLFKNHQNPETNVNTIRGSQFKKPLFEFSGACAGCGETPYLKLLTQLVGEKLVIANATGCSSIYGASCPSTPYKVSWANSLFEDNAEFGLGILESYNKFQDRIGKILKNDSSSHEFYNKWLKDKNDFYKASLLKEEGAKYLPSDLISYLTPKSVWTIGGDGWAYDIGFGGIDHVLSSGENVKILVLDTEVYSNTGGQASKSSQKGAVAEFANMGKKTIKKDLFKIAMSYPNVYVAQISLGANMMQTIKALTEAENHNGPSIVIAYSPCVEHGIKGGLVNAINQQKLAVESGYLLLMRYFNNNLYLDSPEPNFDKYNDFLNNEVRYTSLKIKDKELANELLEANKKTAINRYNYYNNLKNK
ncbi:MAG: pyruvate:ferredoxin (flavodoxin) oxidoreductase [Bacilli bacterium]|nr:pyruvate:ferredoxin (flavodoxin) oxidoreductase [Bacilli bacterium]